MESVAKSNFHSSVLQVIGKIFKNHLQESLSFGIALGGIYHDTWYNIRKDLASYAVPTFWSFSLQV